MNIVKALYQVSLELLSFLQNEPDKEEREHYIQKVEQYLQQRETLILHLPKEYTDEEKQLGKKIMEYNQLIDQRLQGHLENIKKDLSIVTNKKTNQKKYINPYSDLDSVDGMYFDKRK